MTIDEAIQYAEDLGTEEENKIDYDKDSPHTIIRRKNTVKDYRQLAEWLMELKAARQYLMVAIDGFRALGKYLDDHCEIDLDCDKCPLNNGDNCRAWKHTKAVMKLIGGEQ